MEQLELFGESELTATRADEYRAGMVRYINQEFRLKKCPVPRRVEEPSLQEMIQVYDYECCRCSVGSIAVVRAMVQVFWLTVIELEWGPDWMDYPDYTESAKYLFNTPDYDSEEFWENVKLSKIRLPEPFNTDPQAEKKACAVFMDSLYWANLAFTGK